MNAEEKAAAEELRDQRRAEDRAEYDDPDHYFIDRNQNRYEKWIWS